MGWPLRVQIPDSIYHVTFRAIPEQRFFQDESDRVAHLKLCGVVAMRYEWRFLGWCQLGTHGHLLVTAAQSTLSAGMQFLTSNYVRGFNMRHGRKGTLVERRFHSQLIESDSHLLETLRYVPLNAPRAGVCERPEDWPWSSYRATIGLEEAPAYLAVADVLRLFAPEDSRARARYITFIRDGLR